MFTILLIEDNERFRQTVRMVLSAYFPAVAIEEASDGQEAMEKVSRLLPELVIADIKLRGENGIRLTRKIKAASPETQIIILTIFDLPEYAEATLQAGASHFLTKGLSTGEELAKLVASIMDRNGNSTKVMDRVSQSEEIPLEAFGA
jgi:DNA-binding NarL/FixJ family response regulator